MRKVIFLMLFVSFLWVVSAVTPLKTLTYKPQKLIYKSMRSIPYIKLKIPFIDDNAEVVFNNKNLEQMVRYHITKPNGVLLKSDLLAISELKINLGSMELNNDLYVVGVSFRELRNFTYLTKLSIENSNIKDIDLSAYFPYLKELELINTVLGEQQLSRLKLLQRLAIIKCEMQNIIELSELEKLKELYLENNKIVDISPLAGLTKLEKLNLSKNNINDVSYLHKLLSLQELNLSYNGISNISNLKDLAYLKELNLEHNNITNITHLTTSKLEKLNLASNKIRDIAALSKLPDLQWLNLNGNTISDIDALKDLSKLKSLGLANNQITEISSLAGLKLLERLSLAKNPIKDYEAVSSFPKLILFEK